MNVNATTPFGYTYTSTATSVSQKQESSFEKVCENQNKKEYKNVVKEYMQRHPESADHVKSQVRAGKKHIENCGAGNISRSDMTMDEYKAFFTELMDRVPWDSSRVNDTQIWSITEEGWEQMKNDPEYEAWVLGYTVEDRSVRFPFQTSTLCIEKFGASIEEHIGQGVPKDVESPEKTEKEEESWWYKRHKRMKELIKEQEKEALKKSMANQRKQSNANLTTSQLMGASALAAGIYEGNIDVFSKSVLK